MNEQKVEYIVDNILKRMDMLTSQLMTMNASLVALRAEQARLCKRDQGSKESDNRCKHLLFQMVERLLNEGDS